MNEKAKASLDRMAEILKKLPPDAADVVANEAAIRAEAIADYLAMVHFSQPDDNVAS